MLSNPQLNWTRTKLFVFITVFGIDPDGFLIRAANLSSWYSSKLLDESGNSFSGIGGAGEVARDDDRELSLSSSVVMSL